MVIKSFTLFGLFLFASNVHFAQTTSSMKKSNAVEPREGKEVVIIDTVQVHVSMSKIEPVHTAPVQEDPNKTNSQQTKEVIHTSRKRP